MKLIFILFFALTTVSAFSQSDKEVKPNSSSEGRPQGIEKEEEKLEKAQAQSMGGAPEIGAGMGTGTGAGSTVGKKVGKEKKNMVSP